MKDLRLVVNYNCPNHLEDYIHRVGRTGRAGRKGTAYVAVRLLWLVAVVICMLAVAGTHSSLRMRHLTRRTSCER